VPAATNTTAELVDEGGAGALGWPSLVLLSLLLWRRSTESPHRAGHGAAAKRLAARGGLPFRSMD
jgi:hypothetical protein